MMTSTMEAIYRKIELEGVWLVDPKLTTRAQQDAILALRKAGKIEQAAYGGLKVKRDWRVTGTHPGYRLPADVSRLASALEAAGIVPVKPLTLVTSGAVKRTQTGAVSIAVHMPKGTRIPENVWAMIETGAWRSGDSYVVQLKAS